MRQPEGYAKKGNEQQVFRLQKAILKQASRTWNEGMKE